MGFTADLIPQLPEGVEVGQDGLVVEIQLIDPNRHMTLAVTAGR